MNWNDLVIGEIYLFKCKSDVFRHRCTSQLIFLKTKDKLKLLKNFNEEELSFLGETSLNCVCKQCSSPKTILLRKVSIEELLEI